VKQASLTVAQARLAIAKTMLLIQYRAVSATAKRVRECPYGRAMCREARAPPSTPIFSPVSTKVRAAKALWSAR